MGYRSMDTTAGHGYNICTECLQASCESSGGNQVGPFSEMFWHIDSKKISFLQNEEDKKN